MPPVLPPPPSPEDPHLGPVLEALAAEARAKGHGPRWAEAEGVSRLPALRPALPAAEARRLVADRLSGGAAGGWDRRTPPRHLLQALARPAVPHRAPAETLAIAPPARTDPG